MPRLRVGRPQLATSSLRHFFELVLLHVTLSRAPCDTAFWSLPTGRDWLSASRSGNFYPLGPNRDVGGPGLQAARAFPYSGLLRASATLDQQMLSARRNLADRLSGRDRAARCPTRKTCPASDASRPAPASAVNERPRRVTGRVLGPSRQVCSQNLPDRTGGLR